MAPQSWHDAELNVVDVGRMCAFSTSENREINPDYAFLKQFGWGQRDSNT